MMSNYCLGFILVENGVVLARKRKGRFKGRYMGLGGKVEPNETSIQAMSRETYEEVGLTIGTEEWKLICTVIDWQKNYCMDVFSTQWTGELQLRLTEEYSEVGVFDRLPLATDPTVHWLYRMCEDSTITLPLSIDIGLRIREDVG